MRIVKPSVEILTKIDGAEVLSKIYSISGVCYQRDARISDESRKKTIKGFVENIIKRGHESVLEHENITVRFICDRATSHEIVRHRLGSYTQESTRYVNYDELIFIEPIGADEDPDAYHGLWEYCEALEKTYLEMKRTGVSKDVLRNMLPNCLKTELIRTGNLRDWRHFLKLRYSAFAHPQIRRLAGDLLKQLQGSIPVIFDDIEEVKYGE